MDEEVEKWFRKGFPDWNILFGDSKLQISVVQIKVLDVLLSKASVALFAISPRAYDRALGFPVKSIT